VNELRLRAAEATSAVAIQEAIDSLGPEGGRVVLPEMDITIDRGIALRSGVELTGQGRRTILRHAPARVYPLSGYHNYGMRDVPLQYTEGLTPGMTVAIRDDQRGGFYETFARLTWVEHTWVGLDRGLHSDYRAGDNPVLVTAFPLVYGEGVRDVAVRHLTLDGRRAEQPAGIGACRGAAVYFIGVHRFEVSDVHETGFLGEGLGFQMCSHGRIAHCRFGQNAGNGYHPGAGSTAVLFEDCVAEENGLAGLFFCVRANHISVKGSAFRRNRVAGISVGTRDCHNLVEDSEMVDNDGPGLLIRQSPRPVEVHSCAFRRCRISGNARQSGHGQVDVLGDAHDLILEENEVRGTEGIERAGIYIAPAAQRIWLQGNDVQGCFPDAVGGPEQLADDAPEFACGHEATAERDFRHLDTSA